MLYLTELYYKANVFGEHITSWETVGFRLTTDNKEDGGYDLSMDMMEEFADRYLTYSRDIRFKESLEGRIDEDGYFNTYNEANKILEANSLDEVFDFVDKHVHTCPFIDYPIVLNRYIVWRKYLLDIHIPLGYTERIYVNDRLTSSWGRCSRKRNRYTGYISPFVIDISERLVSRMDDTEGLDLVIIHELLHTCPGCLNHGSQWKSWGRWVERHYGHSVSRLSSAEELGVDEQQFIDKGYYACKCSECGNIITRKSLSKFIQHPEWYRCSCGGSFVRIA